MDRVPLDMIVRHACQEVGEFFSKKVEDERRKGKVAILVEDFTNSLCFLDCDTHGYPKYHNFKYWTLDSPSLQVISAGQIPNATDMRVEEVSIMIERPMLSQRYDWQERPYVFLWFGRKMSTSKIPLEKLNVSELLKIAQEVVKNREGLVIDEALKNKIYK